MKKFFDQMGAEPINYTPKPPTTEQIEAIGRALPEGKHTLTNEQQKAWFGRVVFDAPVEWLNGAFVSEDRHWTAREIAEGGH